MKKFLPLLLIFFSCSKDQEVVQQQQQPVCRPAKLIIQHWTVDKKTLIRSFVWWEDQTCCEPELGKVMKHVPKWELICYPQQFYQYSFYVIN